MDAEILQLLHHINELVSFQEIYVPNILVATFRPCAFNFQNLAEVVAQSMVFWLLASPHKVEKNT